MRCLCKVNPFILPHVPNSFVVFQLSRWEETYVGDSLVWGSLRLTPIIWQAQGWGKQYNFTTVQVCTKQRGLRFMLSECNWSVFQHPRRVTRWVALWLCNCPGRLVRRLLFYCELLPFRFILFWILIPAFIQLAQGGNLTVVIYLLGGLFILLLIATTGC